MAIDTLEQVFFLGADGKTRGEASFVIQNQGAPALALPTSGDPTFASVVAEPSFLTRDAEGRIFLPLGQGRQPVVVQDVRTFGRALGFAVARLELPRPGVPASRAHVQLRYPAEWIPLYEELAPSSRLHLLDGWEVALLAVLLLGIERLLALGGLARRRRWLLAGAATALGALSGAALGLLLLGVAAALLALAAALLARRLAGWSRGLALAGLGLAVLVVAAVGIEGMTLVAKRGDDLGSGPMNYVAKMEQDHRPVYAVLVAARLVAALTTAAGLLLVLLALAFRRDLAAGARIFRARLTG